MMKIDLATAKSILVELTKEDLQRFGLSVEQLDYGQSTTRRVLQSILQRICQETGVCYRLRPYSRIDVMADRDGGCLMIITDCEKKISSFRKDDEPAVYFTEDWNNLIDVSRVACMLEGVLPNSRVLKNDTGFYLLLNQEDGLLHSLLTEFLEPVSLTQAGLSCLSEQLQVLIDRDALQLLGSKRA